MLNCGMVCLATISNSKFGDLNPKAILMFI